MDHRKRNHGTCDNNSLKTPAMFAKHNAVKLSSKLQDTALLIMSNFSSSFFLYYKAWPKTNKTKQKQLKYCCSIWRSSQVWLFIQILPHVLPMKRGRLHYSTRPLTAIQPQHLGKKGAGGHVLQGHQLYSLILHITREARIIAWPLWLTLPSSILANTLQIHHIRTTPQATNSIQIYIHIA